MNPKGDSWVCLEGQPAPTDIHMSRLGNFMTVGDSMKFEDGEIKPGDNYYGQFVNVKDLDEMIDNVQENHPNWTVKKIVHTAIAAVLRTNDVKEPSNDRPCEDAESPVES